MMGWWDGFLGAAICGDVRVLLRAAQDAQPNRTLPRKSHAAARRSRMQLSAASSTAALSCSTTDARSGSPPSRCRRSRCRTTPGGARRVGGEKQRSTRSPAATRSCCGRPNRLGPRPGPLRPPCRLCLCGARRRRTVHARRIDRRRVLPGSPTGSAAKPAPRNCLTAKIPPGRPSLAYGAIRIMRCSTPIPLWMCWRSEAALRWSRARWCPCVKAGRRSM